MIKLQGFSEKDIDIFKSWITTKELMFKWTGPVFKWPLDDLQMNHYLSRINAPDPRLYSFNAIDVNTNELIGHVDIDNIDMLNKHGEIIRVIVRDDLRNKGYGKKIIKEITSYGFNVLGLHRLELRVFEFNKQAIACYEKTGFVHEGILRDFLCHEGKYWNLHVMSMINKL